MGTQRSLTITYMKYPELYELVLGSPYSNFAQDKNRESVENDFKNFLRYNGYKTLDVKVDSVKIEISGDSSELVRFKLRHL